MTLDEAIAKAKADGDVQLAEWLRQARGAEFAARWYTEKLRNANRTIRKLQTENAKLREQMERLVTLLCNDCDIEASWDGLRRFWSIELTEDGCLMRDRACKAEAENAKLRELVRGLKYCAHEAHGMCARVPVGGERPFTCCPLYDFDAKKYRCEEFMLELGIEVGE